MNLFYLKTIPYNLLKLLEEKHFLVPFVKHVLIKMKSTLKTQGAITKCGKTNIFFEIVSRKNIAPKVRLILRKKLNCFLSEKKHSFDKTEMLTDYIFLSKFFFLEENDI